MEKKTYKILWIDDEHEKLTGIKGRARRNDIELVPFKSLNGGLAELERNYELYDGVLLDAQILEDEEDAPGTEATKYIHRFKERLSALPKKFELLVLTGQAKLYNDNTFNEVFENVYKKGCDKDVEKLFNDIKSLADRQPETQIKHEYRKLFKILENYNPEASKTFIKILLGVKSADEFFVAKEQFTQLRIILEELFRKANIVGLLHDKCIHYGKVNLTDSSLFLAGKEALRSKVKCSKQHFPQTVAINIENFLKIAGAASHYADTDVSKNINYQEYSKELNTPYLLFSLTYLLMDVILWFDKYARENSDIETNKSFWQDIEFDENEDKFVTGIVEKIAHNGYGTIKSNEVPFRVSVHKDIVSQKKIKVNDQITFSIKTSHYTKTIKEIKYA